MTEQNPVTEKMRAINFRMTREKFRFRDELRLIPRWLVRLMVALFVVAQAFSQLMTAWGYRPWSDWSPGVNALAMAGIVTGLSLVLTVVVFLIAYVNRDAKRRGMSSTLWTLLVIFIPNGIGFIIYFLVREPVQFNCPQCGAAVSARFNFCPSCKHNLRPACPQCGREVHAEDRYCPQCAYDLAGARSQEPGVRS
ncbi:MAG TPA: zinc ribbon domain-containing protein [Terriglobia bacterium]|nr:zinc ribbon domain-containing protein [Terriglobia bacterium]